MALLRLFTLVAFVARAIALVGVLGVSQLAAADTPSPLIESGQLVDWWFVFKFNAASFPGCGVPAAQRSCPFGGTAQAYSKYSQQYVYASSGNPALAKGIGCAGETLVDPIGATFRDIYDNAYFFVVWNDQFYDHPQIQGCSKFCGGPWGHSKGILVWNDQGDGMVMQVTTPSWPAAGSRDHPRLDDGNTLGCVKDNNVLVSQHFFALKLSRDDVVKMLDALQNASVVTDPGNPELVQNGGPAEIQSRVQALGAQSESLTFTREMLSSGVTLISKPSQLNVPPWQFVSAALGGVSLRTATWWGSSRIYTTRANRKIACWDPALGKPGRVEIATTGQWDGTDFGLTGAAGANFNHAKIGHSISGGKHLSIFADLNQEGALSGDCSVRQNGRGGLFFVVDDEALYASVASLLDGNTAPTSPPH